MKLVLTKMVTSHKMVKLFIIYSLNCINSLPKGKILDWFKFKAFADDKINVTQKLKFVLERVENVVGKGENAGYQHFLLFPPCFQKASIIWTSKIGTVW